jgi:hypothetical protein
LGVIDFLLGLLAIAVAASIAMNLRLAMRLRQVEHRLAAGAGAAVREQPAPGAAQPDAPRSRSPLRSPPCSRL